MPKSAFIEDQQRLHFYFFDKPQIRRWGRIWKDLSIVAKKPELLDVEASRYYSRIRGRHENFGSVMIVTTSLSVPLFALAAKSVARTVSPDTTN